MVRSKAPKQLWDHCIERQAYIHSCTANDVYMLNGQVPETIVSGKTADISAIAEFQWYEWVKFRDTSVSFPEDAMILGHDLGPAIDVGPAHTHKILKANGQMLQPLMPDKLKDPDETKAHADFDVVVKKQFRMPTVWEDLEDDPECDTPVLSHCSSPWWVD
jgi:hypothetical protein